MIRRLQELGQSVWLDFLDRALLDSGELHRLIEEDGLRGLTSNPTIFQKAIAGSNAYDGFILGAPSDKPDSAIFEDLQVEEVRRACDAFHRVHEETGGIDGFVSLEVSPALAHQPSATVEEARRLWSKVARSNLMIKIPGTHAALPAIEQCLADGININITLLFSVERYTDVAHAYLRALEQRASHARPLDPIASVASFFVSRVDAKVDQALDRSTGLTRAPASVMRGEAAIANAKLAYERFEQLFAGERWTRLTAQGARPQRILWASTAPKDPRYPTLYYAEALIGPDTVDTMTPEILRAYRTQGKPERRLSLARDRAHELMASLARLDIDFRQVTSELEDEGLLAFLKSYQAALASIEPKRRAPFDAPSA